DFPVAAEALSDGAKSIAPATSVPQWTAPTVRWLDRERRLLVQDDLADADPAPPQALIDAYGVCAQMLAPIERDGRLVGWISVHYAPSPRRWSPDDVAALEQAQRRVHAELEL